jgi:hypothetical protein
MRGAYPDACLRPEACPNLRAWGPNKQKAPSKHTGLDAVVGATAQECYRAATNAQKLGAARLSRMHRRGNDVSVSKGTGFLKQKNKTISR